MKLHASRPARNAFTGYGAGYVEVNTERYPNSVVVSAESIDTRWDVAHLGALTAEALERAAGRSAPDVLLLGCGARFAFPPAEVLAPLQRRGVPVEVMDSQAACRTYNLLADEGRRVVAAVIVEESYHKD